MDGSIRHPRTHDSAQVQRTPSPRTLASERDRVAVSGSGSSSGRRAVGAQCHVFHRSAIHQSSASRPRGASVGRHWRHRARRADGQADPAGTIALLQSTTPASSPGIDRHRSTGEDRRHRSDTRAAPGTLHRRGLARFAAIDRLRPAGPRRQRLRAAPRRQIFGPSRARGAMLAANAAAFPGASRSRPRTSRGSRSRHDRAPVSGSPCPRHSARRVPSATRDPPQPVRPNRPLAGRFVRRPDKEPDTSSATPPFRIATWNVDARHCLIASRSDRVTRVAAPRGGDPPPGGRASRHEPAPRVERLARALRFDHVYAPARSLRRGQPRPRASCRVSRSPTSSGSRCPRAGVGRYCVERSRWPRPSAFLGRSAWSTSTSTHDSTPISASRSSRPLRRRGRRDARDPRRRSQHDTVSLLAQQHPGGCGRSAGRCRPCRSPHDLAECDRSARPDDSSPDLRVAPRRDIYRGVTVAPQGSRERSAPAITCHCWIDLAPLDARDRDVSSRSEPDEPCAARSATASTTSSTPRPLVSTTCSARA